METEKNIWNNKKMGIEVKLWLYELIILSVFYTMQN